MTTRMVSRVKGKCVLGCSSLSMFVGEKTVDKRTEHQCPGEEGMGALVKSAPSQEITPDPPRQCCSKNFFLTETFLQANFIQILKYKVIDVGSR